MKNAIIFWSKTGFTESCADVLKSKLSGETDVYDLKYKSEVEIEKYDTIIIGGGIYVGKISPKLKKFVNSNQNRILTKNIGIFITAGDKNNNYIATNFSNEVLEKSVSKECFGAGLDTKRLAFMEKIIMKMIGKYKDFSDMDKDAVDRFAKVINNLK